MHQSMIASGILWWHYSLQAEPVGFEAVAEQRSQAEVSRLFSAMLQLINNGNIQILPGQSQQPFQLKLLSTNLLHRKFLDGPAVTNMPSQVRNKSLLLHRSQHCLLYLGHGHCVRVKCILSCPGSARNGIFMSEQQRALMAGSVCC